MSRVDLVASCQIERSSRVMQVEGLFDVPPSARAEHRWEIDLPLHERDWQIGLIVGPSGCGKSSILRSAFPDARTDAFDWPTNAAVVDAFPKELGIKAITESLSAVGFSSPPSWLKPYHALSNGEQFRVRLARLVSAAGEVDVSVCDEYTSVVDRTVAQVGSVALAKAARKRRVRLVLASCHYDIIEWLQPDWMLQPADGSFVWRSLQRRPAVSLTIRRVRSSAWRLFRQHHYLSGELHRSARCFVAFVDGVTPAAFTAVLPFPHPKVPGWREHRTVCLPDFQGIGIGNALSDFVGGVVKAMGWRYTSRTSHPGMRASRSRSPAWARISRTGTSHRSSSATTIGGRMGDTLRMATTFRYVGPSAALDVARALWAAK